MAPSKAPTVRLRYANRKSDGIKMAAIVSKDLRKHTASFDKKKDPTDGDSAPLELDLEHKEQTDECVAEFAGKLLDALQNQAGRPSPLRLEEFSLRNNALTTTALRLLAPVIHAARYDLRDIDLSQNNIKVDTPQEARDWETFLQAFSDCEVLRRLDLSMNGFSGSLAFEVFLRVYCRNHPVDPSDVAYQRPLNSGMVILSEKTNHMQISPRSRHGNDEIEASNTSNESVCCPQILKRRKGLRSIPYIVLRNCNLDDAGALHLSYALENHFWPQYLMTKLKDGSKEAKRKEEDDAEGAFGIIYHENPALTSHGTKLLESANSARAELVGIVPHAENTPNSSWVDSMQAPRSIERLPSARTRKLSLQSASDASGDRRVSTLSTDISSLRMRLQRTTIESVSVHGVQLWHAAFKVLYAARVILPRATGQSNESPRYASKITLTLAQAGQSILAVTEESSEPTTPTIADFNRQAVDSPLHRRSLLAEATNGINGHSVENDVNGIELTNGINGAKKLSQPIQVDRTVYRDDNNPRGLLTSVWQKIFVEYANAKGILNAQQQESIMHYARNRSNIASEKQSQVKGESHQVWKILNEMDCLTYELKMGNE